MPERIAVQLRAEMQQLRRDMKRGMSGIRSDMERIEGQSKQINKNTQSWAGSILTSAKHLASAYVTFQGIAGIQDAIRTYAEGWVTHIDEATRASEDMADSFAQVQLQTIRIGDNWERIRKEAEKTMSTFGVQPEKGWSAWETVRSVMSGQQWGPEQRKASMTAISRHAAMTTMDPATLASIHARLRNMFPEYGAGRLQAMIERTIAKYKLGGEQLKKGLKYTIRSGAAAKSFGRGLPGQLALGGMMTGIVANPGRALKKAQMVMREMYKNEEIEPVEGHPYPMIAGLREMWGNPQSREEIRKKIREMSGGMSDRILTVIKPLVEKLPQLVDLRRELMQTRAGDLKEAFGKVMESPTQHLATIAEKLTAIEKIEKARDVGAQRIGTIKKLFGAMTAWGVRKDIMRPGTANIADWVQGWQAKYMMRRRPAHYVKRWIRSVTSGPEEAKRMLEYARQRTAVGGEPPPEWIQRLRMTPAPAGAAKHMRRGYGGPKPKPTKRLRVLPRELYRAERAATMLPQANVYQQAGYYPLEFGEQTGGEMAAQMAENMQQVERNTRRAAENSQRRSHSSDRAGAQP